MQIELPKKCCLLMLDFDGTLVPIAKTPNAIEVPPELPELILALQRAGHKIFIITGRKASSVRKHIEFIKVDVIGLHGLDWPNEVLLSRHPFLDRAMEKLETLKKKFKGLLVEDKGLIIAVHTRQVPMHQQALAAHELLAILDGVVKQSALLTPEHPLNVLCGHFVFELRPKAASKAFAVNRLIKQYPDFTPIYIGDDTADEEVFRALGKHGLSVRVAAKPVPTAASYRVTDVAEVYELLNRLI